MYIEFSQLVISLSFFFVPKALSKEIAKEVLACLCCQYVPFSNIEIIQNWSSKIHHGIISMYPLEFKPSQLLILTKPTPNFPISKKKLRRELYLLQTRTMTLIKYTLCSLIFVMSI